MLLTFLQYAATHILYLALHLESGSFPRPLSPKAEREAFAAFKHGSAAARDELIRHNLRLVAHVTKKYYAAPDSQDDLISIGTIGLIKAVDTFDPARAVRFSSYASQCIENELRMHLRHTKREGTAVSLQEPLESGTENAALTLGDVLPDDTVMEDDYDRREVSLQMRRLLKQLSPRAQQVLALRYGVGGAEPQTQQQVAEHLGISRSYVSRLEKRALDELRIRWTKGK
jgi:RNA polymerase sporulation-specific sigma factor